MPKNPKQLHIKTPSGKVSAKKAAFDKKTNTGQATGRLETRSSDIFDATFTAATMGLGGTLVKGAMKAMSGGGLKKATGTVVGKGGKIASKAKNTTYAKKNSRYTGVGQNPDYAFVPGRKDIIDPKYTFVPKKK